jgi:hypothetical protein
LTFSACARFETELLPELRRGAFFRLAPDEELRPVFAAYDELARGRGTADAVCDAWRALEPTRARLAGVYGALYQRADRTPRLFNGLIFLASLRAVLAAGLALRAGLRPEVRRALETEFPWLEHRHEHVPAGHTPAFRFPPTFAAFLESGSLDDARARWQLVCALNEVQQASYSAFAARRFDLPALLRHAERERALALNYLGHFAPRVTFALFRQAVLVLDGLNAAVFDLTCRGARTAMLGHALVGMVTRRAEWRAFEAGLEVPQRLLPVPRAPRA